MLASLLLSIVLSLAPSSADAARAKPTGACIRAGCSSQLCVDPADGGVITTCEYRPEYACYNAARCERQRSGRCGWTKTKELKSCLKQAKRRSRIEKLKAW